MKSNLNYNAFFLLEYVSINRHFGVQG